MWRIKNSGRDMVVSTGTVAISVSSGAINGAGIEVHVQESGTNYQSGFLFVSAADAVGAPSAISIATKIQDSADGSTDWTDVSGLTYTHATESAAGGSAVDLSATRRYIRIVSTTTLTGGTSPNIDYHSGIVLSGDATVP